MEYNDYIENGYKEFGNTSTTNGTMLYKRMHEQATFIILFNSQKECIGSMCLNDDNIKELTNQI